VLAALALMMMAAAAEPARAQTTFTVNTTSDTNDGTCDASHCSLREAITAANAAAGADTIEFAILPAGGVHVIAISGSELPALEDDLVIDGYTQAGASPNTSATGGLDTQIRIQLQPIAPMIGLRVRGSRVTIRGLALINCTENIFVDDDHTGDITIAGNFLGTNADGLTTGASEHGVLLNGSAGLTIGGTAPADRNLIAGNSGSGIRVIRFVGASPLVMRVHGNLIGTDVTGQVALANGTGLRIEKQNAASADDRVAIGGPGPW
jgi:CSLREA domain-containing protein